MQGRAFDTVPVVVKIVPFVRFQGWAPMPPPVGAPPGASARLPAHAIAPFSCRAATGEREPRPLLARAAAHARDLRGRPPGGPHARDHRGLPAAAGVDRGLCDPDLDRDGRDLRDRRTDASLVNPALFVLLAFLLLAFFLGVWARRGHTMSLEQWTVGGRGFG